MKKFLLHPLFLLVVLLSFDVFFLYVRSFDHSHFCFSRTTGIVERSPSDFVDYKIYDLNVSAKPVDLAREKEIPLFKPDWVHYPKIYGMKDRYLVDLGDEVAIIGKKGPMDVLLPQKNINLTQIVADSHEAYILLNDRLYIYNGRYFDKYTYRIPTACALFLDKKYLYIDLPKRLMAIDRSSRMPKFYKNCTGDRNDTSIIHAKDGWIYTWQKRGALKRFRLDYDQEETLFKRVDFLKRWQDYYVVRRGTHYWLYRYPKKHLANFELKNVWPFDFFVMRNRLYLANVDSIFAYMDLKEKKLHRIDPIAFQRFGYALSDQGVAFVKDGTITQVDPSFRVVRRDKIRVLPDFHSFAADGNHTAAMYYSYVVLDGKTKARTTQGKIYYRRYVDTRLALDGDRLAVVGFDMFDRNKLRIDLFEKGMQKASYELKLKADYLYEALLYRDIVVAAFYDKTVLIQNGKIIKTLDLGARYPHQTIKRVGSSVYLSYGHNLKAIDLKHLKVKIIDSDPLTVGLRKGGDFLIERETLAPFMLRIDFKDKNVTVVDGGGIEHYFALKDYAIFQTGLHSLLAISKKRAYRIRMTLQNNKIMRIKPLSGNRFVELDGLGLRIVDLDRILPNPREGVGD